MTAPDLSDYERATVERIEAAEPAEESLRERVARAICEIEDRVPWDEWTDAVHDAYRQYADAAIAIMRGES